MRVDIEGELVNVVALEDLIRIKQTPPNEIDFILRELRTPELLIEAVSRFPSAAQEFATRRPAIAAALRGDIGQVRAALRIEQDDAMRRDRLWWEPLKRDLEQFRHQR